MAKLKTSIEADALAFNRLSDWVIIQSMYKRHELGVLYSTSLVGWTLAFYLALR